MQQQQQQDEEHHHPHFLLLTFPAQGHLNPALQFAKRLLRIGGRVTFLTTVYAYRRFTNYTSSSPSSSSTPDGLSFTSFSDGYDDGFTFQTCDPVHYMSEIKRRSSEALTEIITKTSQPFTCLVYTLTLPWAAKVARAFHLPSALLCVQPALVFDVYYYYFFGYGDVIKEKNGNNDLIDLPGLPPLSGRDLPSFMDPTKSDTYPFILQAFKEQLETIAEETNPRILVNTFDALEPESLRAIDKFNMIAIGPLTPSALLEEKDQLDSGYGVDLFNSSSKEIYMEWLSSKPKSSVIYVSFGSILFLGKRQMEEIARGLLESGHPFLWVVRDKQNKDKKKGEEGEEDDDELRDYKEELNEKGMIVPWCSQVEVLSHAAVSCFITHCGWNSSLESLVSGVPVVAFPQWTDQGTNAKIMVDLCKTGVRVNGNEEGIVESDEIKKCLEMVMGEGDEFRRNALKWKNLAKEATKVGGTSDANLKAFADELST